MKKNIILFLKGIILGLAFIIPGVSGGTLAVTLGLYEDLIEAVSHFYESFKNFKKYFKFIFPIVLGVIVSIAIFARIIQFGLLKAPIITTLCFLGLIIGGLPSILNKVRFKRIKMSDVVCLLSGIIILIGISFLNTRGNVNFDNIGILAMIKLLLVGLLASVTMVVPGISGSFMLMVIGYYEPILKVITELTQFTNIIDNLIIIAPFGIGVIFGIVMIAKLIEYALDKYERKTYFVIIGFVLASLYQVVVNVFSYNYILIHYIVGIVLMILSTILVNKFFSKK